MKNTFCCFDSQTRIERVAQKIMFENKNTDTDGICVTKNDKYAGVVPIKILLDAMTGKMLDMARGSNPLTGFPGNPHIQQEIEKLLSEGCDFDVCCADINNFKPFNDRYGFERGDAVIKALASCIKDAVLNYPDDRFSFVGHIGGDDFLLILEPKNSSLICENIIERFSSCLPEIHGLDDFEGACFVSEDRAGKKQTFPLLGLSMGIVNIPCDKTISYARISSLLAEVKKAAKNASRKQKSSALLKDRRKPC
jgi:GGDEF domain-containing protein